MKKLPGLIIVLAPWLASCGRPMDVWREQRSPDQKAEARITRWWGPPLHAWCRLEIETKAYRQTIDPHELLNNWAGDVDPGLGLSEIAWSPDSRQVAFLVGNPWRAAPRMAWIAFDVELREVVDPTPLADVMRETLRRRYPEKLRSRPDVDPLVWAESDEAMHSYFRRYGHQ